MQHPDPRGTGARGDRRKLLAGNFPILTPASPKCNPSAAALERPRSPFPIYWRPDRTAPGFAHVGLGGV